MAKIIMAVIDCETNGLTTNYSVLSASAIKFEYDTKTRESTIISEFNRYYYPEEKNYNWEAIRVNGLDKNTLKEKRKGVKYSKYFSKDKNWNKYIKDVDYFIGHKLIMFDSEFMLRDRLEHEPKKMICTMLENIDEVKVEFPYSHCFDYPTIQYKYPSLIETAVYYNIEFDKNKFHGSLYDCQITLEIFKRMINKGLIKIIES